MKVLLILNFFIRPFYLQVSLFIFHTMSMVDGGGVVL